MVDKIDMELLQKMILTHSPSGNEEDIRSLIMKEMKPYVDEMEVDILGNLICRKKGKEPKIMVASHMDEIGIMVRYIGDQGNIYFQEIGGVEPLTLIGQSAHIITEKGRMRGVISTANLSSGDIVDTVPEMSDLFFDTGLDKETLDKIGVKPGDYIYLESAGCSNCGAFNDGHTIVGKALDDRLGCYILCELAKRLKNTKHETIYVFTVQEEIGSYGAITSSYQLNPAWAIAVDVTDDTKNSTHQTKVLGKGPTVTAMDADIVANRCINNWLYEIAEKEKIPIQIDVSVAGATDASVISISKKGTPSTVVGVPVRNIHSTISMANISDIRNCILLLEKLLKDPPKVCLV